MNPPHISVLITCFNRRAYTLECLRALYVSAAAGNASLSVFLVDDGSTDGTGEMIRKNFPDVQIIEGDGSLYWNGGMRRAWGLSLGTRTDFYLWLNDDLALASNAIENLLSTFDHVAPPDSRAIVVGKVMSPDGSSVTYGGKKRRKGLSRLSFTTLDANEATCVTFNGNCVLFPTSVVTDVGINSDAYRHSMGDIDYGLRATQVGYRLYQTAEAVGFQDHNTLSYFRPRDRTLRGTLKFLNDPKGMPVREWLHFCRRHGGWLWPANFLLMFGKMIASK